MYYESNKTTHSFPQPNSRQKAKSLSAKFLQREAVWKSQETLSNGKSLGSVQLAIPLQAREQGAWMTLLCFSPVPWLVEWLLETICSWGSHQGSPQAALAYHRHELVFEMLQKTQRWCTFTATGQQLHLAQLRSRCFCCQLHFQIFVTNAIMLIPRIYKYLHHDWHVAVFLLTTRSFPLTSGQTNSDCHRLECCTSEEHIYF